MTATASPVVRTFTVPPPPPMPDGCAWWKYAVDGRRVSNSPATAVDSWLARGTDTDLQAACYHYTPCLPECRLVMPDGTLDHADDCNGGSVIYWTTFNPDRGEWSEWRAE